MTPTQRAKAERMQALRDRYFPREPSIPLSDLLDLEDDQPVDEAQRDRDIAAFKLWRADQDHIEADERATVRQLRSATSFVYFIRAGEFGPIKIGVSRDPLRRLYTLDCQSSVPLELLAVMAGTRADEQALHRRFATYRRRFEWFEACDELLAFIGAEAWPWDRRAWFGS